MNCESCELTEELLHDRRNRLLVDQVVRHEGFDLLRDAHALLDRALHTNETDAVLVLDQLAHRADAAVTEVVDVVDRAAAVLELDEVLDREKDVFLGQHLRSSAGCLSSGGPCRTCSSASDGRRAKGRSARR